MGSSPILVGKGPFFIPHHFVNIQIDNIYVMIYSVPGGVHMNDSISELVEKAVKFRDARNWKQFHNPKDLAISISLEAAELLEVFQWSGSDTSVDTEKKNAKVREELADVLIYCALMANDLSLDISDIVMEKLRVNDSKYPVAKAYGRSDKYTVLASEEPEEGQ